MFLQIYYIPLQIIGIIGILFIIPTLFFFGFFFYKFIKTHRLMLGYLAAMNLFYTLSIFLLYLQFFTSSQVRAEIYFIFSEISKILLIYFLLLIFEIFYRNTQYSKRQTITTILVFMIIGGLISQPDTQVDRFLDRFFIMELPIFSPIRILQLLFSSVATVFLSVILLKSRKTAWNSKQKRYISWLFCGSLIGVLIPSLVNFILENSFGEDLVIASQILPLIPQSISILMISLIFFKISKNLWLLQRQQVYFLIVYSHSGLTLYSKSFSKDITKEDTYLLAAAFSAISTLIQDGTKTSENVKAIMLDGKLLKIITREQFICALLVEYSTQASDEAHEKFTLDFEKEFQVNLKHFNGDVTIYTLADKISKKYFT